MTTETVAQPRKPLEKLWSWAKAAWWARGMVSAFAIVSLLDAIGFSRQLWLPVIHAIGVGWNYWMMQVVGWINFSLPDGIEITAIEANTLLVWSVVMLPPVIGGAVAVLRGRSSSASAAIAAVVCSALCIAITLVPSLLLPSNIQENGAFIFAGTAFICAILVNSQERQDAMAKMVYRVLGGIGIGMLLAILAIPFGAPWYAFLSMIVIGPVLGLIAIAAQGLWISSETYTKALFATLTGFLALELLYMVPAIEAAIGPTLERFSTAPFEDAAQSIPFTPTP